MDDRNDRGKRDRLNWREIDQIRDKSRSRERDPMQKQSSPASLMAQKTYRAALERAFAAGTVGELVKTLSRTSPMPEPRVPTQPPAAPSASEPRDATPASLAAPAPVAAPLPTSAPVAVAQARNPDREQRQKMLAKIREAEGRDSITRLVDAYLARYERLPDDYELLTKALAHKDDERVRATLVHLEALVRKEKPKRARTLAAQLRFLEDTHTDGEIRVAAAQVRSLL